MREVQGIDIVQEKNTKHQTSTLQGREDAKHNLDEVIRPQTAVHNEFTRALVG